MPGDNPNQGEKDIFFALVQQLKANEDDDYSQFVYWSMANGDLLSFIASDGKEYKVTVKEVKA